MLNLTTGMRIYLAPSPGDMRRSFDGLSAVILEVLQHNPLEGHLFMLDEPQTPGGFRQSA